MRKLWDLLRNKIGTKNLICGILGICIAVGWMWSFTAWRVALVDKKICETQRGIADEVFRFHVLANSDSEKDQRDEVLLPRKKIRRYDISTRRV